MSDDVTYGHSDDEICRRVREANTQVAVLNEILEKMAPLIEAGVLPAKIEWYVRTARNTRQILSEKWFGVMQKRTSEALWQPSVDFARLRAEYAGNWTPEYFEDIRDRALQEWVTAPPNSVIGRRSAHEHLGMSREEYDAWVEWRNDDEGEST